MILRLYLSNKNLIKYNKIKNLKKLNQFFHVKCNIRFKKFKFTAKQSNLKTLLDLFKVKFYNNNKADAWLVDTKNFWIYLNENYYFSTLFKQKTVIKYINAYNVIPSSILPYMIFSAKSINWRTYKITHSNEIVELLFICLWLKNLNLFMVWVQKFFEKTSLKRHKKLVLLLGALLGKFVWGFNIFLMLKGLRVSIIGKFGKAGSVRKSRKYIKRGKCSFTSKNLAMISKTKIIRTLTGVFSIKLEVFF